MPPSKRPKLQHLRAWREYRLLSQFRLHILSGVSVYTISHVEAQDWAPQWGVIQALADGLGITKEQLVYEAPPPQPLVTWEEKPTNHKGGPRRSA